MRQSGEPIYWLKVHGSAMQRAGEPDLSITYAGRSIKAELKTEKGKATPLQLHRLKEWEAAGATVGVVRSLDDLKSLLKSSESPISV